MATLVSPGVDVTITDESAYASPGAGTIPLVVVATRQDKADPTGTESDSIAKYTKATNAGKVVPVTSQRELTQFFGNAVFDSAEGAETSEYGLLAAYSFLGQGSQAYIVRADVDMGELVASTTAPTGPVSAASYWLDTDASSYGIHEYNGSTWTVKDVTVEVDMLATAGEVAGTFAPSAAVVNGTYLVAVLSDGNDIAVYYFKGVSGAWVKLAHGGSTETQDITAITNAGTAVVTSATHGLATGEKVKITGTGISQIDGNVYTITRVNANSYNLDGIDSTAFDVFATTGNGERFSISDGTTVTFDRHHKVPANVATGDVWIKTSTPGNGINLALNVANATGVMGAVTIEGVTRNQGSVNYVPQDGSSNTNIASLTNGNAVVTLLDDAIGGFTIDKVASNAAAAITGTVYAQADAPVGTPANGALWFDATATAYDILTVGSTGWERVATADIQYATAAPTTKATGASLTASDIWIDTDATAIPALYKWNGTAWTASDNTDQSTSEGVLFADISDDSATASGVIASTITGGPDFQLYPTGMLAINMLNSGNTVRSYSVADSAWRNAATNHADGSGAFGRLAQRKVIATAMQAAVTGNEDLRDPARNFTLLVAPNFPELTDELVTLNSDRGETGFIIIDTPMRKSPTEAVAWVGGVGASENGEDGLVTKNTYSAVYYPAGRSTTPAGSTVPVPASHMALYQYAYSDSVSFPWFAPAGLLRGVVQNGSAVGYITGEDEFKAISLNQGQRDAMYTAKLNPIANFPAEGVVLFGQKSLHAADSALDRVNVARLVAHLRERFDEITRPFLFEQNDKQTRDRAKAIVEGFLLDILAKRGVTDFAVVCDESNNTPARIDRNELYIDVAIEPTKSVEFIYIPIRIVNTGTL